MRTATYQVDKDEILDRIFTYLVGSGLENVTICKLCKGTGIVQGSLYYWFGDKTSIICEVTEHGLRKVTDRIFAYVFASLGNLRGFFSGCLDEIAKYKPELRFIYQMAASPVYGETIRRTGWSFNLVYDKYVSELAPLLGCDGELLRPLVYLFISAVLDYIIWDEHEKTQMQLEFIYSVLPQILHK